MESTCHVSWLECVCAELEWRTTKGQMSRAKEKSRLASQVWDLRWTAGAGLLDKQGAALTRRAYATGDSDALETA
ncbi:hypothetical protein L484_000782 [Morus notabilis]|uniref:Uncharacterized protein n=1 Tax=Morus notabilis TaxID=981085 RepID=W9SM24_9ROSA|nr:hypothetical protein L484_000782 [Morus notabilis]